MKRPLSHDATTFDRLPGELARYERDLDRRFAEFDEALPARLRWQPMASAPLDQVIDLYAEGLTFERCSWDATRAIWLRADGLRLKATPTRWLAATPAPPSRALPSEPTSTA